MIILQVLKTITFIFYFIFKEKLRKNIALCVAIRKLREWWSATYVATSSTPNVQRLKFMITRLNIVAGTAYDYTVTYFSKCIYCLVFPSCFQW